MLSVSTYRAQRRSAEAVDAWEVERDAARAVLRERDVRAVVDALSDGDPDLACDAAQAAAEEPPAATCALRLAESRETANPAEAVAIYERVAEEVLQTTDRRLHRRRADPQARARRRVHPGRP